jgi:hypothetical protein
MAKIPKGSIVGDRIKVTKVTTIPKGSVVGGRVMEKLLSGGGIKVTKGAWKVPKWLAFVASQVVLLGETW